MTLVVVLVCLLSLPAALVWGSPIIYSLYGDDFPVSATVVMDYDGTDTLSLDITNASTSPTTSYITAFAFNLPNPPVTGVNYVDPIPPTDWPTGWSIAPEPTTFVFDSVNTPVNYGYFDVAGITGPNFGGGSTAVGIGQGDTLSFDFVFSGENLNLLATADFFSLSHPKNSQSLLQPLVVRFQGIDLGGGEDESDVALVPIPSVILLFGSGLLGLAGIRSFFIL